MASSERVQAQRLSRVESRRTDRLTPSAVGERERIGSTMTTIPDVVEQKQDGERRFAEFVRSGKDAGHTTREGHASGESELRRRECDRWARRGSRWTLRRRYERSRRGRPEARKSLERRKDKSKYDIEDDTPQHLVTCPKTSTTTSMELKATDEEAVCRTDKPSQ